MPYSFEDDRRLAIQLAELAANAIRPYFRNAPNIENKAGETAFDPVTEADKAAERVIRDYLGLHRPQDAVEGEEYGRTSGTSGRRWIIDPIDGTRAFISGLPTWGTLIGLAEGETPLLGVASQPYIGDVFSGGAGKAYLNETAIRTRACPTLAQARIATTDPELFSAQERDVFEALSGRAQLRRLGLDWYAYAHVAAGHMDVVIEADLKPHDIAALIPIIESAGGRVMNWRGGSALSGGQVLALGDPRLADEILPLLAPAAL